MRPGNLALVDTSARRGGDGGDHEDDLEALELGRTGVGAVPFAADVAAVVEQPLLRARSIYGTREEETPSIIPESPGRHFWLFPRDRHEIGTTPARSRAPGAREIDLPAVRQSRRDDDPAGADWRHREHAPV